MKLRIVIAMFMILAVPALHAQYFEETEYSLPGLSRIISLSPETDGGDIVFSVRDAGSGSVFSSRRFGYNPHTRLIELNAVRGCRLFALVYDTEVYLYDPYADGFSQPVPHGVIERSDSTDYLVGNVMISRDGQFLRVTHLELMGQEALFYDIRNPLSPVLIAGSDYIDFRTVPDIDTRLLSRNFIETITGDSFQMPRKISLEGPIPQTAIKLSDSPEGRNPDIPVFLIFPVGWSASGLLAYVQISDRARVEPFADSGTSNRWCAVWVVQDTVTDREVARTVSPLQLDYSNELIRGDMGFSDLFSRGSPVSEMMSLMDFSSFGIGGPETTVFIPARQLQSGSASIAADTGTVTLHIEGTPGENGYSHYTIQASLDDGRSKIISEWHPLENIPRYRPPRLIKLSIAGALASVYEDRIAVILAGTFTDPVTGETWVELSAVGCHTRLGYR